MNDSIKFEKNDSYEIHKEYLENKVNVFLKPLVKELLKNKPDNVLEFILNWSQEQNKNNSKFEKVNKSFNSSDEEDDDINEEIDKLVIKRSSIVKKKNGIRAEVYNPDLAKNFIARIIAKTENQSHSIRKILSRNFMFNGLSDKDKEIVVNAMEIKEYEANDFVIKQGEDGFELFIVESGLLKCTKKKKDHENEIFIKNYSAGELFGELSLMYNVPRAASIMSLEKSIVFALDRETFNNIVKGSIIKTREKNEKFISKIDILKDLDTMEVQKICDCLQQESYLKGDLIIKEGDIGEKFYLIEDGNAVAFKTDENGNETEVYQYSSNDYFGELALLNENKRKASIRVISESMTTFSIDREAFKRLLGPIEDILKRNEIRYQQIIVNN